MKSHAVHRGENCCKRVLTASGWGYAQFAVDCGRSSWVKSSGLAESHLDVAFPCG